MSDQTPNSNSEAFIAGRAAGLALAAMVISLVAFLQLLGAEKALVGLVLGVFAYRSALQGSMQTRRLSMAAIGIAILYILLLIAVLVFAGEDLLQAIMALDRAS